MVVVVVEVRLSAILSRLLFRKLGEHDLPIDLTGCLLYTSFKNISAALSDLKEFLAIRENDAIFDNAKKNGGLGIPCFVLEDGTRTLDITKVIG